MIVNVIQKDDGPKGKNTREAEDLIHVPSDLLDIKLSRLLELTRDTDEIYGEGIFTNSFGHDIDVLF